MNRWALVLMLAVCPAAAKAQSMSVGYQQTIRVAFPGALAAFSLNDFYAEAKVQDEELIIFGKNPGLTQVVVVAHDSTKTFAIRVLPAPPSFPPGFVQPLSASEASEEGSYESRYTSGPSQLENILDFTRQDGNRSTSFYLDGVTLFTRVTDRSTFSLSSVYYRILTPHRDITLLDELMTNSPLTVDGSTVRGIHYRQGGFLFDAGYTSLTTFENYILPSLKEGVVGVGYRYSFGNHESLTPNFYFFPGRPASEHIGQRGTIASLVYEYQPGKSAGLLAEVGFSRGVGAAVRFHFNDAHYQLSADLRYEPTQFASLSSNNLHGFYSDFNWIGYLTPRLTATASFSGDHYNLPSLNLTDVVSNLNLQVQLARDWSLITGINYGSSDSRVPAGPDISTLGVPIGVSFYSNRFQGGVLYQYSRNAGIFMRSDEFRANLGTRWSGFHLTGFADYQTQAPTISFVLAAVPEIREALDDLAVSATTAEQISIALRDTAALANQGFIRDVNVSLSPVRFQAAADLAWSNRASSRQQFHFDFLYNRDDFQQSASQTEIGTLSYSWRFTNANQFFVSSSLLRTNTVGTSAWQSSPLLEISIRHHFATTPNFIIPRRKGTIRGAVFADSEATGIYHRGRPLIAGVEVVLDDTRRIHTDRSGHYSFSGVSYGSHVVELDYTSTTTYFLTTASRVQTDADTEVNFGVAQALARLLGYVRSDAGVGLPGVTVHISNGQQQLSAQSDSDGKFRVEGLSPGEYDISVDMESVPAGYSLSGLATQRGIADASAPARVAFTVKAIRNVSGRVMVYDRASHQETPVPGITVLLREVSSSSVTDEHGAYLFRDLPPGPCTLVVRYQGRELKRVVVLPDGPAFSRNVDIDLGGQ